MSALSKPEQQNAAKRGGNRSHAFHVRLSETEEERFQELAVQLFGVCDHGAKAAVFRALLRKGLA